MSLDAYQRTHAWLGFPLAVVKKIAEDMVWTQAALIAYYGFLSLFPLLVLFVSAVDLALGHDPSFRDRVIKTVLDHIPVIGKGMEGSVIAIRGNGVAVAVSSAIVLFSGLAVTVGLQNAFNAIWGVERKDAPNFFVKRARGLAMIVTLGTLILATTILNGIVASGAIPSVLAGIGTIVGTLAINVVAFVVMYRVLTVGGIPFRRVLPGSLFGVPALVALQGVVGYLVTRKVGDARAVYGGFALVVGLMLWIYVIGWIVLLGAEVNVVLARRLWPRRLGRRAPVTGADRDAFRMLAERNRSVGEERIDVTFEGGNAPARGEANVDDDDDGGGEPKG